MNRKKKTKKRKYKLSRRKRLNKETDQSTSYLNYYHIEAINILKEMGYSASKSGFVRLVIDDYFKKIETQNKLFSLLLEKKGINTKDTGLKVATFSLFKEQIQKIENLIEEKRFVSRSEFIRTAMDQYMRTLLECIYEEQLSDIYTDQNDIEVSDLNPYYKNNQVQLRFGNPHKIEKGFIYEFRFNDLKNPRWVRIGKTT